MILHIFLIIIMVGMLLWTLNNFVPLQAQVKSILNIVAVLLLIFWLLKVFHILDIFLNAGIS